MPYSMKGLMEEHEDYEFKITYSKKTGEIKTNVRMPSGILLKGLAFTLAGVSGDDESLDMYLDKLRLEIKQIRQDNGS